MPVYDYRCEQGHRFDAFQSMSDKPLVKCEECGAKVERVLHAPAIHFKGSGFHNTDYGTKKRPVSGEPTGGEKKATGGDATPAAAPSSGGGEAPKSSGKTVGLDKA